jgi:hypothetical protein
VCNREYDCFDGSDENYCGTSFISYNYYFTAIFLRETVLRNCRLSN